MPMMAGMVSAAASGGDWKLLLLAMSNAWMRELMQLEAEAAGLGSLLAMKERGLAAWAKTTARQHATA